MRACGNFPPRHAAIMPRAKSQIFVRNAGSLGLQSDSALSVPYDNQRIVIRSKVSVI
jgi:hypothetical protein